MVQRLRELPTGNGELQPPVPLHLMRRCNQLHLHSHGINKRTSGRLPSAKSRLFGLRAWFGPAYACNPASSGGYVGTDTSVTDMSNDYRYLDSSIWHAQ
jgi:hypothetical protein